MLSRRELSRAQLEERLRRKGFAPDAVRSALQRLQETGALDDHRAAHTTAHTAAHVKLQGRHRTARELGRRGIERALSDRVIDEVYGELDEQVLLERALARRLSGSIATHAELRRLYQYLLRQGFDDGAAQSTLMARTALVKE